VTLPNTVTAPERAGAASPLAQVEDRQTVRAGEDSLGQTIHEHQGPVEQRRQEADKGKDQQGDAEHGRPRCRDEDGGRATKAGEARERQR
jgi:hypothetical protein